MKLAEALIMRADNQKRLAQLRERIIANAKVQEGETPSQEPQTLIAEFERVVQDAFDLLKQINKTNSLTEFENARTLTDALAERDILALRRKMYGELVAAASLSHNRYSRTEIKYQSTVDVAQMQKQADDLARDYRQLDTKIQALNWNTDLVE